MTEQTKIDAANSFFSRSLGKVKGLDLEALKHVEVALKDMEQSAAQAMILAGKVKVQQAVGPDAAFDIYAQGKNASMLTIQAQTLASLLFAALKTGSSPTNEELEVLICDLMLKALDAHEEMSKLAASAVELARKA